jgi:hypothetical protein
MLADILNSDRHAFQFNVVRFAFAQNFIYAIGRDARTRNQYLLDIVPGHNIAKQPVAPKNGKTVNYFAALFRSSSMNPTGAHCSSRLLISSRNNSSPASPAP